jgi:DNA-binding transcriptional LysR family regulator
MEIIHLRYAVSASKYRSFRSAAAALNITQPTLSKRIRELEDQLNVRLFKRSPNGARLTADGEAFVTSANQVLADLAPGGVRT